MTAIRAGTEIRDGDGKLIATIVHDMHEGDLLLPEYVRMADGTMPVIGEQMPQVVWDFIRKSYGN